LNIIHNMLELRDREVVICIQLAMLRRADGRHYLIIDNYF